MVNHNNLKEQDYTDLIDLIDFFKDRDGSIYDYLCGSFESKLEQIKKLKNILDMVEDEIAECTGDIEAEIK